MKNSCVCAVRSVRVEFLIPLLCEDNCVKTRLRLISLQTSESFVPEHQTTPHGEAHPDHPFRAAR